MSNDRETDIEVPVRYWGVAMLKAILIVLLSVVTGSSAAEEFKWNWDVPPNKKASKPQKSEIVNPNAKSEWVKVASQNTYIIFVNPAYMTKVNNIVTVRYWYDLQIIDEVDGKPFRSANVHAEYNCMNEQMRTISAIAYGGSMAREAIPLTHIGDSGFSGTANANKVKRNLNKRNIRSVVNRILEPGKWKPVAPGSTQEILFKYACEK